MSGNSLNYYGYDKHTYKQCLGSIHSTNRKHILMLNTWFLFANTFYLIFSILNLWGVTQERILFYAVYVALAVILEALILFLRNAAEHHSFILVYVSMALMLSYGILASISKPYMPATMFMLLLVLSASIYMHQAVAMSCVIMAGSAAFVLTSFRYKTFSIAYTDTYNAVMVTTLAVSLHFTLQRTKLAQFISYQKELMVQRELEVKSDFDALTSLLNRSRFFSLAKQIIEEAGDESIYMCIIDLDEFKEINDRLGHQMGDKAIQITGNTIIETLEMDLSERWNFIELVRKNKGCFAGRLGGDEFIVLIRGRSTMQDAVSLLQNLLDTLNGIKIDRLNGIHASLGVTKLLKTDEDIDMVYARADSALYESKRLGKNRICFSPQGAE